MSDRVYPLIFEFLLLGKATKLANAIKRDPRLEPLLDTYGPKCVVLKFKTDESKEHTKKELIKIPYIQRGIKNKLIKIE